MIVTKPGEPGPRESFTLPSFDEWRELSWRGMTPCHPNYSRYPGGRVVRHTQDQYDHQRYDEMMEGRPYREVVWLDDDVHTLRWRSEGVRRRTETLSDAWALRSRMSELLDQYAEGWREWDPNEAWSARSLRNVGITRQFIADMPWGMIAWANAVGIQRVSPASGIHYDMCLFWITGPCPSTYGAGRGQRIEPMRRMPEAL